MSKIRAAWKNLSSMRPAKRQIAFRFGVRGRKKGGAKRHKKVLRDNIQGITKPTIRRLAMKEAGVKGLGELNRIYISIPSDILNIIFIEWNLESRHFQSVIE